MNLVERFEDYIKREALIKPGDRLILGVSGGPDSLTMLDLFMQLKDKYQLELIVFHLNHQFREEAAAEANFVADKARHYQLEAIIEKFDVPGYVKDYALSPEEAAREIRFRLMTKCLNNKKANKIALAHNRDDQVETVFLNLLRGTGLRGLSGISPMSSPGEVTIIHPLLSICRSEIEEYCQQQGLDPRYDQSNQETIYTRNKIRLELIPYLEQEINPGLKDVIARMSDIIRKEDDFLTVLAEEKLNEIILESGQQRVVMQLSSLQQQSEVFRNRIIRLALIQLKGNNIDLYFSHYQAINQLIAVGETGSQVQLKDNIIVRRSYQYIIIEKDVPVKVVKQYSLELPPNGEIRLPDSRIISSEVIAFFDDWEKVAFSSHRCCCDADRVKYPLTVRNRRQGDRFIPLGMKGKKKLKDFFIDQKIPRGEREIIPLVLDNSERILWVAGYRMDDRYKITDKTDKILKLCIK